MNTLIAMPGGWELIVILIAVVLIFGVGKFATSLPELARGSGQALRIFKSETKGIKDEKKADDEAETVEDDQEPDAVHRELPPASRGAERQEVPSERQEPGSGA